MADQYAAAPARRRTSAVSVPPRYRATQRPTQRPTNSSATASFALGIAALVLCWVPIVGVLSTVLAVAFGVRGLGQGRRIGIGTRAATTGLVLGLVSLVPAVIICVAVAAS